MLLFIKLFRNSDFSLFHEYILNFSSGLVSANSDIRVTLAFDKQEWQPNQEIDKNLFDISDKEYKSTKEEINALLQTRLPPGVG